MNLHTLCVHGSAKKYDSAGAISVPIFQSATFAHESLGRSSGFDYSRQQNPTREHLEITLANLEGGLDALAFSSGMAAITALMELFSPGDHIIASDDLYGGSHRLFSSVSVKNGLEFDFTDTSDVESVKRLIRPRTKAFFIETPTNPMMRVTDIRLIAELARNNDILTIVDNTFLTPALCRPLSLGADAVVHSGSKYLGGHNDALAGFLVVNDAGLSERLRYIYKTTGACLSPFDSWLIIRGIKTLAVRVSLQRANALKIAEWLKRHEKVEKIYYVGLPEHPGYEISKRQAEGFGAMISFQVDSRRTAENLLSRVKIIQFAESLGGVESLITYPMTQTHADLPEEEREKKGINDRLARLSVGIEDSDDLIEDLRQALEAE
ncbi:MAG: PLP-dependent aspartate aminotransferase family protein [Clostridiales bacterium]|nr:PLP-dependent aspartate aminotransferase family protein [Clostridiales bacterium]